MGVSRGPFRVAWLHAVHFRTMGSESIFPIPARAPIFLWNVPEFHRKRYRMPRLILLFAVAVSAVSLLFVERAHCAENAPGKRDAEPITVAATDWPWWRGPNNNGVAAADQSPPLEWSSTKNVLWKTPVPGRGHGSATVVGNRVYLATAEIEEQLQSVICYDRQTGDQIWKTIVHRGGLATKGNKKSSQASSTVACDGHRLFINFLNEAAVYTTALSHDGKQIWQQKISDYIVHQGYGSSPALYGPLVIVSADNKSGGAVAGFERMTGRLAWKHDRPKMPNYSSPIILNVAGRDQLLLTGCDMFSSFAPLTGKKLWEAEGSTTECVTSTVTDGELIYSSGGYPKNHIAAIRADGSREVVWENRVRVYVPSLLVRDGYLYAVVDAGVAMCWKSDTGKRAWTRRLGGNFTASPVLVGENIFATSDTGHTTIFRANPKGFELVGENDLGDQVYATPTICNSRIYLRVAEQQEGRRQEMLYCLGAAK